MFIQPAVEWLLLLIMQHRWLLELEPWAGSPVCLPTCLALGGSACGCTAAGWSCSLPGLPLLLPLLPRAGAAGTSDLDAYVLRVLAGAAAFIDACSTNTPTAVGHCMQSEDSTVLGAWAVVHRCSVKQ
jgi:hypothetical protein